jgi:alanyl-tRNA synthetase
MLPSASLVPENDPSVLFNTAGMQPLVPYLMGQRHPSGNRLVNIQKCVRTQDIDEVGDNTHDTFFEMMGNWSLGDYFKEDAIKWSYEFLTSKEEGLGLDPNRLYVTVFEGDENAPKDMEAFEIWKKYIPENRIYFMSAKSNWWSVGDNGPCGPDTEMFYDITQEGLGDMSKEEYMRADEHQQVVEIWNDVFMEYEKRDGRVIGKLAQKNVDTGSGLERVIMAVQGKDNIFETDLFAPVMRIIENDSKNFNLVNARIVADHLRTATFLIADGVVPSSKDQGYVLRRIIRRAIFKMKHLMLSKDTGTVIMDHYILFYSEQYPEIASANIRSIFRTEEEKFNKTLQDGLKEFESGVDPFILATTYGFPIELTEELAKEKGITIDRSLFDSKMAQHQNLSRTASAGMFKGGLADHNKKTIKLHTAHHLLLAGLQRIVDSTIKQRGSNITEERLRIDFLCDHKLSDEEKKSVEAWVNEKISEDLRVICRQMPLDEAERIGAEMEFGAKYPDTVSVYFIEDEKGNQISKEFCGGPHVENTGDLGHFKIQKEEAVSSGIRRIKAVLE